MSVLAEVTHPSFGYFKGLMHVTHTNLAPNFRHTPEYYCEDDGVNDSAAVLVQKIVWSEPTTRAMAELKASTHDGFYRRTENGKRGHTYEWGYLT